MTDINSTGDVSTEAPAEASQPAQPDAGILSDDVSFFAKDLESEPVPSAEIKEPEALGDLFNVTDEEIFASEEPTPEGEGTAETQAAGDTPEISTEQAEESPSGEEKAEDLIQKMSIDVNGKEYEFNLGNTEDPELRGTLRKGIKFDKLRAAYNKAKEFDTDDNRDKVEVWGKLQEFHQTGNTDRAVQALLGDGYEEWMTGKVNEILEYQEADPARRAEMDLDRKQQDFDFRERERDAELEGIRNETRQRERTALVHKLESYMDSADQKFGFKDSDIADSDRRYQMNAMLEDMVKAAAQRWDPDGVKTTPRVIAKLYSKYSKLLRGNELATAEKNVDQVVSQKQEEAKKVAAAVATSNYPTTERQSASGSIDQHFSKWDGNMKSLKSFLRG